MAELDVTDPDIAALIDRIAALEAAMRPFAEVARMLGRSATVTDDIGLWLRASSHDEPRGIFVRDVRAALAALAQPVGGKP